MTDPCLPFSSFSCLIKFLTLPFPPSLLSCPLSHICHSMISKPSLTVSRHSLHTQSWRNFPPPTWLIPLSSPSYFLSSSSPCHPTPPFSCLTSVILHNSICLSIIHLLRSQPSPPLSFFFIPVFSHSSLCLCFFSSVLPVLDTVSGTQMMSDIYKTGLARITFTHPLIHRHAGTQIQPTLYTPNQPLILSVYE